MNTHTTAMDLGRVDRRYSVTFVRRTKHAPARLWRALTEASEVSAWMDYPATRIDPRQGGDWWIDFSRTTSGRGAEDAKEGNGLNAVVVYAEPERGLGLAWGPRELPGGEGADRAMAVLRLNQWEVMEWTIQPEDGGGCTYTFAHHGLRPENMKDESVAWGWHGFLDQLDGYLDGTFVLGRFSGMTDLAQREFYDEELKRIYRSHLDELLGASRGEAG